MVMNFIQSSSPLLQAFLHSVGLLKLKDSESEQPTMDTVLIQRVPPNEKEKIKKLMKQ